MEREYERRTAARYQLRAPVVFHPGTLDTNLHGAGFVKDVSTKGVFVRTMHVVGLGQTLDIEILVPQLGNTDLNYVLRSTGVVIRTTPAGFAATADFMFSRLS